MKKILRNNKGSISALVVISVLLYSIVLTTAFMKASGKRRIQIQSQILAKEEYEKPLEHLDEIRQGLIQIKVGDYVNYTYDTVANYVMSSTTCGSTQNPTDGIPQTKGLKWRVLNIDRINNAIDLVSDNPTGTEVYFKGVLGYNNAPYFMNEICYAHYSNSSLGVYARNINLLDMETTYNHRINSKECS